MRVFLEPLRSLSFVDIADLIAQLFRRRCSYSSRRFFNEIRADITPITSDTKLHDI